MNETMLELYKNVTEEELTQQESQIKRISTGLYVQ